MMVKKILVSLLILSLLLASPGIALADADGSSVGIMTEYVNYYYGYLGLPDLNYTDEAVNGLYDIVSDPNTNWLWSIQWGNDNAWERDWKSSHLTGGNDYRLADDVDLAAFSGHGTGRNFVMNNANYDHYAATSDMRLGDRDLEWLLAFTCNFLNGTMSQFGSIANGLHLANGYSTDMTITSNAGSRFSYWAKRPYGVRVAWYRYGQDTQRAIDENIARTFGANNSYNDYLWGYGSVSSDPPSYASSPSSYGVWDTKLNW